MSADALLPAEVRPQRHCRRCGRAVPTGPLIDGLGSECASQLGLLPRSARLRGGRQDGPDLFHPDNQGATVTNSFIVQVLDLFARNDLRDSLYWRTDGEYAPVTFWVNCSDVFAWGSADVEPLTKADLDDLRKAFEDTKAASNNTTYGPELYCARRRRCRPQGAAYPGDERLWPLFDACGPEREIGSGNPRRPGERSAA